jgi:phosphoserine phosphatase
MREKLRGDGWGDEAAGRLAAAIAAVAAEGRSGIATLDFDDTCIAGDLGDAVFHHAAATGSLAAGALPGWATTAPPRVRDWLAGAERALAAGGPAQAYGFVLEAFAGWPLDAFRAHCRTTLAAELEAPVGERRLAGPAGPRVRSGIRFRSRVGSLVARLHDLDWQVWIVSGSAEWAVEEAVGRFGVAPARVRGQRVAVREGVLTGEGIEPAVFGPGKVAVLEPLLAHPPDLALGDSPNDRELLGWARTAVVMDAGDANSLGREAGARGWAVEPTGPVWRPDLFD